MMQTDVKSVHTESTGLLLGFGTRLKAYQCSSGGTGGDVIIRDGGVTGNILLQFNIPSSSIGQFGFAIPGEGILFKTDIYVTLPADAKITIFYG